MIKQLDKKHLETRVRVLNYNKLMEVAMRHLLLITFAMFFITACSSTKPELKNNDKKLVDLLKHFESYGVKIDKVQRLESNFFHAEEALAVEIDGKEIGLYRFDLTFSKAKRKVEMVKKKNIFYIQAIPYPAVINGSFMMINYDKHPRGKEFVKIFKSFTEDKD